MAAHGRPHAAAYRPTALSACLLLLALHSLPAVRAAPSPAGLQPIHVVLGGSGMRNAAAPPAGSALPDVEEGEQHELTVAEAMERLTASLQAVQAGAQDDLQLDEAADAALLLSSGITAGDSGSVLVWPAKQQSSELLRTVSSARPARAKGGLRATWALAHRHMFGLHGVQQQCEDSLTQYFEVGGAALTIVMASRRGERPLPPIDLERVHADASVASLVEQHRARESSLTAAVEAGSDARTTFRLANLYYRGSSSEGIAQDYARARQLFERAAEQGFPAATTRLGYMALRGMGRPANASQAEALFRAAAAQGDSAALLGLGQMFGGGVAAVPRNYTEAFHWFSRAAEAGIVEASATLATYYRYGYGCQRNLSRALHMYERAARSGLVTVKYNLAGLYRSPDSAHLRNCQRAAQLYKSVSDVGELANSSPFGAEQAYNLFESGNKRAALLTYLLTAQLGNVHAQLNAAFLLRDGSMLTADDLRSSADMPAQRCSPHTSPDYLACARQLRAVQLLEEAAAQNSSAALRLLGDCHHSGWQGACDVNRTLAKQLYEASGTPAAAPASTKSAAAAAAAGGSGAGSAAQPPPRPRREHAEALFNAAVMNWLGQGGPRDLSAAHSQLTDCLRAAGRSAGRWPCLLALQLVRAERALQPWVDRPVILLALLVALPAVYALHRVCGWKK